MLLPILSSWHIAASYIWQIAVSEKKIIRVWHIVDSIWQIAAAYIVILAYRCLSFASGLLSRHKSMLASHAIMKSLPSYLAFLN